MKPPVDTVVFAARHRDWVRIVSAAAILIPIIMAKYYGSNWGTIKNKVGNAVGRVWNTIPVMSQWVPEISNPRTVKQQLVRAHFKASGKLAKAFGSVLKVSMKPYNKLRKTTQYALFTELNWDAFSVTSPDSVITNYSELIVSYGQTCPLTTEGLDLGSVSHLHVKFSFDNFSSMEGFSDADQVYPVILCPELNSALLGSAALANAGSVQMEVPAGWNGMRVYVYAFIICGGDDVPHLPTSSVYVGNGEIE